MTTIKIHPSELAYAFSYSETVDVIGWGREPFLPTTEADGDPKRWYVDGAARMTAAGRLIDTKDDGLNFTDEIVSAVLTLADPSLVLLAERKAGDGLRRLTVHIANDNVIGMTQNNDGLFELTHYADLTAATLACVGFLGAARSPSKAGARVESDQIALNAIHKLAVSDEAGQAIASLVDLGATEHDAASIVQAMADPSAAGVLSVFFCSSNVAQSALPFSVMTNTAGETWILFPPASLEGPMIIERSSVSALTARVLLDVAVRLKASG